MQKDRRIHATCGAHIVGILGDNFVMGSRSSIYSS